MSKIKIVKRGKPGHPSYTVYEVKKALLGKTKLVPIMENARAREFTKWFLENVGNEYVVELGK